MNQDGSASRLAEIAYVALVAGVAVLVWMEAGRSPPAPYEPLGPGSIPRWAAAALFALAVGMGARLLFGRRLGAASVSLLVGSEGDHRRSPMTAILTLLLAALYATLLGLRVLPFVTATGIYLFLAGVVLGPLSTKRVLIVALVAGVAAVLLDQTFRLLFRLDL